MSRDVITVGSTIRISLLYQGEYSQWHERFMNYLEEQTDGESMINSIQNGDQPLPVIAQVSLVGTAQNVPPTLKDAKFWTAEEEKTRKIDRLARSLLIQRIPNDIYSLIDSNETAKDLWDALVRQMRGSEYGEQDIKAAILYEYETFKAIEGEQLLDTYLRYLQVINDLKKCGYNYINIDTLYNILKKNQGYVNDALGYKKKIVVVTSDSLALVVEKTNTKMSLAKKDNDEQVPLIEDQAWMEFERDSDQEINANMVFMAQIEKVLLESDESSSSAEETITDVAYYTSESESESEFETSEYYDNSTNYSLFVNNDDDQEIFHDAIESASENFIKNHIDSQKDYDKSEVDHNDSKEKEHLEERYEYMIRYSALFDNDKQHTKQIADQKVLFDKMTVELVELDKHVRDLKNTILEKDFKISKLEECVCNKDPEIEKCLERLNVFENKIHKMGQTNQIVHMIMPSKDNFYNGRKGIGFENSSYFEKAKDLRPTLYDEKVIGLGYTLMFLTHSDEALEIEKFKRSRENKIEFAYDYENLNASYQTSSIKPYVSNVILEKIIIDLEDKVVSLLEKEKANLETIESLNSKGFKSSENVISESKNQSENDCLEIEKECDKVENSKVIAPRMFKLSVSQSVSPILMSQSSCDYKNVEIKLKRKRHKQKSSKQNDKQVNNDVSCANSDFVHFLDLDTFSSVRRPKNSGVIWKKNGLSNTSNVDLFAIRETSSAYVCNDAMNVSCNPRMCDLLDDNNFFIFDDESVRISPVSKMPFRKKPHDSMNARSKSNMIKSLPRTVHKWLLKMQPLAEPVAKWFPRIYLWIIDSRCSKHMTGNRALLMNFVEKFLGTVCFGNNNFAVIAGYGDVGLKITFRKSTCFVRNEDGVDLLTGDRSSNLYTIALNKVASNSSTCLLAKAFSSQSWLWHQRLSYLNFVTINNLVKNNLVQGLPKMKFEKDHLCSACEQEKIHRKHHKPKIAFASNKPLYLLHMDLCGLMRV
nr:hypothetical protein [Tanacetum cinerariifolium]